MSQMITCNIWRGHLQWQSVLASFSVVLVLRPTTVLSSFRLNISLNSFKSRLHKSSARYLPPLKWHSNKAGDRHAAHTGAAKEPDIFLRSCWWPKQIEGKRISDLHSSGHQKHNS